MELWIRSQDKKSLRIVSNINIIHEDGKTFICNYTGIANIKLGTYKTEQRASEVLDEIQEHLDYLNIGNIDRVDDKGFRICTIYEMPKE